MESVLGLERRRSSGEFVQLTIVSLLLFAFCGLVLGLGDLARLFVACPLVDAPSLDHNVRLIILFHSDRTLALSGSASMATRSTLDEQELLSKVSQCFV